MCDYSVHLVANRPAKIEDKLVATKFDNSMTRGFAAVEQPNVAVCLLPGTEIAFDENVECEPSFGGGNLSNKKSGSGSRASGKSIWTTRWPTTMRWNFPTGRWY
jgi:hypothetical protein